MNRSQVLQKVSMKEKREWIAGDGRDTHIKTLCDMMPDFIETSCLITSAALRKRITPLRPFWTVLETENNEYAKLTASFLKKYKTFEISFGCNEDYDSHTLIVHEGMIYQSFFRRFDWNCKKSPFEDIEEHDEIINFDKTLINSLVGENLLTEEHYDYIICVPNIIP